MTVSGEFCISGARGQPGLRILGTQADAQIKCVTPARDQADYDEFVVLKNAATEAGL
jgi:hypothetical protein